MKKTIKIISIITALILIIGLLFLANALVGNPLSKSIVTKNAKSYVKETYPNTDYYVDKVGYDFKNGSYFAFIKSPSSIDTYFSLDFTYLGKLVHNSYSSYVEDKFNTFKRINSDYRTATEKALEKLPYDTHISYGEILTNDNGMGLVGSDLNIKDLILDANYDIKDFGSKYGKLTLYIYTNQVTPEKACEVLLKIKEVFNQENQAFYVVDLVLDDIGKKDAEDKKNFPSISIDSFLYSDIYEENLLERVKASIEATEKYYEELDKKK